MIMRLIMVAFVLTACTSTPPPEPPTVAEACTMVYAPHLCVADVDGVTFGAVGSNRCHAVKELLKAIEASPLVSKPAKVGEIKCGEVFTTDGG